MVPSLIAGIMGVLGEDRVQSDAELRARALSIIADHEYKWLNKP